ncbi:MAG: efflux RND transporter periplasmic adaptor subunit [Kiloniellales bacterium]|nr:efflux RND transporter periplasmic adaptor subunit [Kiloniellales bacterium]
MPGRNCGRALLLLAGLGLSALLLACEDQNTYVAPPAPEVTVARPLVKDVTEYLEFTGTTVAYARVEVPARVPGVLQNLHFEPGTPVTEGDLLFTIDPVEYEAEVKAAEAELARAEARRTETSKTLERAETLIKRGNISQAKVDEARANFLSAKAEILVRQANLTQARINLGYTQVRAPITGRVGRDLVDVGNLVGQGEATILTDITTFDPMYVYFEVNERDLLRYMNKSRAEARGQSQAAEAVDEGRAGKRQPVPLEIGLANEDGYPHPALTDFAESQVDPDTGTIRVRGIVQNPGEQPVFVPGLFVRVRLPFETRPDMPLVTERAVGFDQSGQYVLLVNSENIVEKRNVTLGPIVDGLRVITDGIEASDMVVVKGLQRAREGAAVKAREIDMATLKASAIKERLGAESDAKPDDRESQRAKSDDVSAGLESTDQGTQAEAEPAGRREENGAAAAAKTSSDAAATEPAKE